MSLFWESSYEIVLRLIEKYPNIDIESVGIDQLFQWVISMPDFADDPMMANDGILNDILREWYEEINTL